MEQSFWKNKKVFISGHTGFKGTWLVHWLNILGANIVGASLQPTGRQKEFAESGIQLASSSHFCDIRDADKLQNLLLSTKPDVIFHLAAQAIVADSYQNPRQTFETNVMGTINILETVRKLPETKAVILATTDKVYSNRNLGHPFVEEDPLGGDDPYSASKACAEWVVTSYKKSFFRNVGGHGTRQGLATVRAGNVIGGGDWSEYRLIPDLIRAKINNTVMEIRHPEATRPWQHVLDALNGYILLAEQLYSNSESFSEAWNFGPDTDEIKNVRWVVKNCSEKYDLDYRVLEDPHQVFKEKRDLSLDSSKAKKKLGWRPHLSLVDSLNLTWEWYEKFLEGQTCSSLCESQITAFQKIYSAH